MPCEAACAFNSTTESTNSSFNERSCLKKITGRVIFNVKLWPSNTPKSIPPHTDRQIHAYKHKQAYTQVGWGRQNVIVKVVLKTKASLGSGLYKRTENQLNSKKACDISLCL